MSKFEKEQVYKYPTIIICGFGIVGKHLKEEFPFAETYDIDVDMKAQYKVAPKNKYQIAFICVPTPKKENGECDTKYVEEILTQIDAELYVIKSTVPPETTEKLKKQSGKNILFSPEFYGNTQFATSQGFVIIGGDDAEYNSLRNLYELTRENDFVIYHCKNTEAEIIKYMENCFLALKVIFCNQFKDIADLYGVSYSAIRDGVTLDSRIGKSHTFVFDNYRGYDSKCLNKDVPALIKSIRKKGFNGQLLMETVESINNEYRKLNM